MNDPLLTSGAAEIALHFGEEDVIDGLARNRITLTKVKQNGNILTKQGGDGFQPRIEFKEATRRYHDGTGALSPSTVERWANTTLHYKGVEADNFLSLREWAANRDKRAQVVNIWDSIESGLKNDVSKTINESFYIDGPATDDRAPDGMFSFMAYTQTLQDAATTPTARTANIADPLGYSNDSYGGRDTDLAAYGGAWSGDYFTGSGTPTFDHYTPHIFRCKSTKFGGTSFEENSVKIIGALARMQRRNKSDKKDSVKVVALDGGMYESHSRRYDAKERVMVKEALGMPEYGHDQEGVKQDGLFIFWDFDCPENKGFAFAFENITMRVMLDELLMLDHDCPKWEGLQSGWYWIVRAMYQNDYGTPRNYGYLDNTYSN